MMPVAVRSQERQREAGVRGGVLRVELDRSGERLANEHVVVEASPARVVRAEKVGVVCVYVRGPCSRSRGAEQLELQRLGDLGRDFLLNREYVDNLAIIGGGPQVRVRRDVDELRRDAHARAGFSYTPLEHVIDAERCTDRA